MSDSSSYSPSYDSPYDDDDVTSQVSVPEDATEADIRLRLARYQDAMQNAKAAEDAARSKMAEAKTLGDERLCSAWQDECFWKANVQRVYGRKIEATSGLLSAAPTQTGTAVDRNTHTYEEGEDEIADEVRQLSISAADQTEEYHIKETHFEPWASSNGDWLQSQSTDEVYAGARTVQTGPYSDNEAVAEDLPSPAPNWEGPATVKSNLA